MLDNITLFFGEVKCFLLNFLNFLYLSHKMLVFSALKNTRFPFIIVILSIISFDIEMLAKSLFLI